jgi:hypothetical protein
VEVGADPGKAWYVEVFANNDRVLSQRIEGGHRERSWQKLQVRLEAYAGRSLHLRLYQRTLITGRLPGNAYWRRIELRQTDRSVRKEPGSDSIISQ